MVTLEDIYGTADMDLIHRLHPTWDFYRDENGVLKCRVKSDKKEDPAGGTEASSG